MPSRRWLQSRRLLSDTRSSPSCTGLKTAARSTRQHSIPAHPVLRAFIFHALNGLVVLLVALALLIVSFFAKIPHGVRWAVIVLVCTVVQIALGGYVARPGSDRSGARRGRTGPLRRRRDGGDAGAEAGCSRGTRTSRNGVNTRRRPWPVIGPVCGSSSRCSPRS